MRSAWTGDAQRLGSAAAIASVALGISYMAAAGAPLRLLLVNGAALAIGLAALAISRRLPPAMAVARDAAVLGLGLALLSTSLFGLSVEGATRWVAVGNLTLQPSLIIAPLLVTAHAAKRGSATALALAVAILAVALQPDRAVAAMFLAGVLALVAVRRARADMLLALLAAAALAWTVAQPDRLPATPFVDQILYTSFAVHPLAGVAVAAGLLLLLSPGLIPAKDRGPALAFGACWATAVLAAALGNYPTPLVGYGGSAIIGYLLSLAPLGGRGKAVAAAATEPAQGSSKNEPGEQLRFA